MMVKIEYVAQMKDAAGTAAEDLVLPAAASVRDAVRKVAGEHGGRLAELLLDAGGDLLPSALVFVGDDQIEWEEEKELSDGERITIMAPLAGG